MYATAAKQFYNAKTNRALIKYGPGPRLHYHVGYFGIPGKDPAADYDTVTQQIRSSQQTLIDVCFGHWEAIAPGALGPHVIDHGCGLGGTSIYLAERKKCTVTAVTIAQEHTPLIRTFTEQAGVSGQVTVHEGDVHTFTPPHGTVDTAVAIEACCHFDRARYFPQAARTLKPGGYLFIEDFFRGPADTRVSECEDYYSFHLARPADYHRLAEQSGLEPVDDLNLTEHTTDFWTWSIAWSQLRAEREPTERAEMQRSIQRHRMWREAWQDGGIQIRALAYRKRS